MKIFSSFSASGRVSVIYLDDAETLNSITEEKLSVLPALVQEASAADYVVLQSTCRAFCVGGDPQYLNHLSNQSVKARALALRMAQRWVQCLVGSGAMTIAAVEGLVAGAGVDVMLACDAILLSPAAKVNLWYTKLGAIPDLGGLFLLQEQVGSRRAMELYAGSSMLHPEDVEALGLGRRLDALPATPDEWESLLRKRYPITKDAFRKAKSALWATRLASLHQHQELVAGHQATLIGTEHFRRKAAHVLALRRAL